MTQDLANYLLVHWPDEIGEGTVDEVAIRILERMAKGIAEALQPVRERYADDILKEALGEWKE